MRLEDEARRTFLSEGGKDEDFEASWAEIRRRVVERVMATDNAAGEGQKRRMRELL